MATLIRKAGVPIKIKHSKQGCYDYYYIEGFYAVDPYTKNEYPFNGIYFSVYHPTSAADYLSWGCGVSGHFGSFGYWLSYPEIWDDEEFVKVFTEKFDRWGTYVACVTDIQLGICGKTGYADDKKGMLFLEKMNKHFNVHMCGHFPNYLHGPNNMNFIAIRFSSGKAVPAWARKEEKHEEPKVPVQMELADIPAKPARPARVYARNAAGRFTSNRNTL